MIKLTDAEKRTLEVLGKRFANVKKNVSKEFTIPDRPVNEIFLSINGSPEDYAFRGIKNSWKGEE